MKVFDFFLDRNVYCSSKTGGPKRCGRERVCKEEEFTTQLCNFSSLREQGSVNEKKERVVSKNAHIKMEERRVQEAAAALERRVTSIELPSEILERLYLRALN